MVIWNDILLAWSSTGSNTRNFSSVNQVSNLELYYLCREMRDLYELLIFYFFLMFVMHTKVYLGTIASAN